MMIREPADHSKRRYYRHEDEYHPDIGVEKVEPCEYLWVQLFDGLYEVWRSTSVLQTVECHYEVIVLIVYVVEIREVDLDSAHHIVVPAVHITQKIDIAEYQLLVVLVEPCVVNPGNLQLSAFDRGIFGTQCKRSAFMSA